MGSGRCFGQCHSLNGISMISFFVLNSLYEKKKKKIEKNDRILLKKILFFARESGTVRSSSSLARKYVLIQGFI